MKSRMPASGQVALRLALAALACASIVSQAWAQSCAGIVPEGQVPAEGTLLFRDTHGWTEAPSGVMIPRTDKAKREFAYVVVDTHDATRAGKLVIKTGIDTQLSAAPPVERPPQPPEKVVHLKRLHQPELDRGECQADRFSRKDTGKVSSEGYDRFHDQGVNKIDKKDSKVLTRFHTHYVATQNSCEDSSDRGERYERSGYFWFRILPPNRAQFAFNESVVAEGYDSRLIANLSTNRAFANIERYVKRRVESRRYALPQGKTMACITFEIPALGTNQFLRVSDLEARNAQSYRVSEGNWLFMP